MNSEQLLSRFSQQSLKRLLKEVGNQKGQSWAAQEQAAPASGCSANCWALLNMGTVSDIHSRFGVLACPTLT